MERIDVKRAIEESFPIVEINRLAAPERNAFKPIYQMHKWFARRASCVFRAILLSAMKPAGTDIMQEFYNDHTNDPDTNGRVILDPFMGGGTTVVEALRLGCRVIGIDLNPVAWFIVKTEVEPVDIEELKRAFERLANRPTASGRSLRQELLSHYKTECPCCGAGREEADIIYNFWVKSAICTNPQCRREVPLYSNYLIAQRSRSIRYHQDAECPECAKTFDWEIEPAAFIAEPTLMINSSNDSAGLGRGNRRWTYSPESDVACPWCAEGITPKLKRIKAQRKKVLLTVLLCPHCSGVWQYRGTVPEDVTCPVCQTPYRPHEANVPSKGKFLCPDCGTKDAIIHSIRRLPEDQLLPMRPYAIEGYCAACAGDIEERDDERSDDLFCEKKKKRKAQRRAVDHACYLTKNKGKFFKRIAPADLASYQAACERWEHEKENLPYPKQEIPEGYNTNQMIKHHYRYWHQMFNSRQLLCLATLLRAIDEEPDQVSKEMLLSAFFSTLNNVSDFCSYRTTVCSLRQVFARHDFAPKNNPCENNIWGTSVGMGRFTTWIDAVLEGKSFFYTPWDYEDSQKTSRDPLRGEASLKSANSANVHIDESCDFVITDPPYAGNVNYSELADYFYVWLRLVLAKTHAEFAPELTPKAEEIIENRTRGKTAEDFEEGLTQAFRECHRVLKDDGLMVFTFHHAEGSAWESLLSAVCNAGFVIEAVYPIHGEAESSLHLMGKQAISYDLIHVCKKRAREATATKRSWAGIRQEIRRRAREEIKLIEAGRYGHDPLSPSDVNIILIGKCLELYSRHYGAVVNHQGKELRLQRALEEIRMMVDQLITHEQPLPSELADIDPESYVYLTCLCNRKEIKSDEVHKATRGILEIDELLRSGFIIKGRAKRGRTYEVKQPTERLNDLLEKYRDGTGEPQPSLFDESPPVKAKGKTYFIDKMHLLMGLVDAKENLVPWLARFRGDAPQIRAACEYLAARRKDFAPVVQKIQDLMDVGPLFR